MPLHNTANNAMKGLSIESLLLLLSSFLCAAYSQDSDPFILIHPEDLWVMPNQPATLKCKAVGTEPIQITWYHDGKFVKTLTEDPQSNKMILPIGHLVFVQVRLNENSDNKGGYEKNEVNGKYDFNTNRVNSKSPSDIGNYYCNASNPLTHKFALSNVASVKLAVLEDNFEKQPQDIKVEPGEDAVFTCLPPRGEPPPEVKWRKDGIELEDGAGYDGEDERTLVVPAVEKQDAGTYSCVAFNEAGEKKSRVAVLIVKEKPRLVQGPRDTEVKEGADVVMDCIVRGDPTPRVTWFKNDQKTLGDRFTVLEDNSLKIKKVKLQDQGTYKCFGENPDGNISVEAKLSVQTIPTFLVSPGSKMIGKGRDATFACQAAGNPQPAVFWKTKEGSTILPENQQGPYEVLKDGTMFIRAVVPKDAGNYMCQALSLSGDAISIASLVVKEAEDTIPPMLGFLPQNQTLPAGATGVFSCSVASRRPTGFDGEDDGDDGMSGKLIWMKNGRALVMGNEERMYLDNKGYLVVEDLQRSDSGTYTCNLYNKYADYSWSSFLNVISNVHVTNGGAETIFVAPEPTTYPMLSSKPYVTDVTENSLKVVWKDSIYAPPADEYFFHVELFSFSRGKGWEVLATDVTHNWFIARNLEPNTLYSFVIRVKTPLLIGPPTQPTQPIKTKSSPNSRPTPGISNYRCTATNSTTVNITWNPTTNTVFDGYRIKYNFIGYAHAENNKNDKSMQKHSNRIEKNALSTSWPEVTIHSPKKTWVVLSGLKKHATYLYYVESFLRNANKQFAKNLANFTTLEDVPSGTPQHVHPVLLNNTLLRLQWQPPLTSETNGHILGYKIKLTLNDSSLVKEMQVNNSVTSMLFFNLLPFKSYQVQIAAFTKVGAGPYNSPVLAKWKNDENSRLHGSSKPNEKALYNHNQNSKSIYTETWFLGVIVALIGCCIWIASCLFCFLFYRRRKHANNSSGSSTSSACRKPEKLAETQKLMPVINSAYLKNTNNVNNNNNNVNENYNPILKKNSFDEDASRQQKDQQAPGNMASSGKLCNNCNNTLIASCCYNHCVSDIECSRMNNNNNNNNNNVVNYNNNKNNNNNMASFNNNDTNNIQSTFYQHSPNQLYHTLAPTFDPNSNNNSSSDHSSNTYGNLIGLQQQLQQKQQQLKQQQMQHKHLQQQKHLQMHEPIPPALPSYQLSPQPRQVTPPSQHYPPQNQQHLEQQRQNLQQRLLQQQMLPKQHSNYLTDQPSYRSIPDGSFNQLYNEQDDVVPPVLFIPPPPPSEELTTNNDNNSSNIDNIPRKFGTLGKNSSSSSGNKLSSNNISKNMMEKNKKLLNTAIYSDEDNETCPDVKSSLYPSSSSSSSSSLNDKSIEEFGNRKKSKKSKKFSNDMKSNNNHLLYLAQNFQEDTEYEIDESYKDSSVCQSDAEMIPQYYNNNNNNNNNNNINNDNNGDDNALNNHVTNKTRQNNNERTNNYDNIAPYNNTSGMVKVDKMLNNYNDYDYINNYSFETSLAPKLSDI